MINGSLPLDEGLFSRLRREAGAAWKAYVAHDFVLGFGRATSPQAAFRRFLVQDTCS